MNFYWGSVSCYNHSVTEDEGRYSADDITKAHKSEFTLN